LLYRGLATSVTTGTLCKMPCEFVGKIKKTIDINNLMGILYIKGE
jgi:hypothetical protein